ncbi:NAD(P)H-dependent oxidoreductase [Psychrosphaera haliotis]|uniref:NADPH-dependent FMN reductase n=1 Tax=Psychrosphaera haliotis TaxID=555083 RepID=UPI002371C882|nr:NAD(P)H-dependent oxidoreductase [Psychrosphaera haliotis]
MNITVISGSTRNNSASYKTSLYLQQQLLSLDDSNDVSIFDLSTANLPMWEESLDLTTLSKPQSELEAADAFIFVVPEWHGMVPPALKNIFFLFTGVFRHKPAYIVTVSAGSGGRYPIQEMRSTVYKNTYLNFLPVNTVIDRVNSIIDEAGCYIGEKQFVANRVDEGLRLLLEYSKAFQTIRKSKIVLEKRFPNGV